MSATEFKAQCLSVIDMVHKKHETVFITKRGRVMAKLVPEADTGEKPWLKLRGKVSRWTGDPFAPVLEDFEINAER